jgi:pre-rRNA-processing protein TSR1
MASFDIKNEENDEEEGNEIDEDMESEKMSALGENNIDETLDDSQLQRFKQQRENRQWPDEMETPQGMNARERFQRYRGLKSFRY